MLKSKITLSKYFLFLAFILFSPFICSLSPNTSEVPPNLSTTTDVVIVSTNDLAQASYWQSIFDKKANDQKKYIVVYEDWPNGADNGLGTLYAFVKANKYSQDNFHIELKDLLAKGGGVSLFHCAGMGKRLYPLTASEYNNKSAVKIPSSTGTQPILELVLEQTLSKIPFLKGRFSVFWGDQIFVPTIELSPPKAHAEVFAMVRSFPSKEEWIAKNLDQYGLIIINDKKAKLVEKPTYAELTTMVTENQHTKKADAAVGVSLGSFSISSVILEELLETFKQELANKKGKLNTDYHFWMPLTWSKEAYTDFMLTKGYAKEEVLDVYHRIQKIKDRLGAMNDQPIFGVQNVGQDALWWDFGSLKAYYRNLMALLSSNNEAGQKLLAILGIDKEKCYHPDNNNFIINCDIKHLDAKNSILVNVQGKKVVAKGTIVINSTLNHLDASQALIYNVDCHEALELNADEVRADLFLDDEPNQIAMYTSLKGNGKEDWSVILPKNEYSFEHIYNLNESRSKTE